MSDEAKKTGNDGEWQMPEPVFRSTEGYTPKKVPSVEEALASEPDADELPTETPDKPDETIQTVRPKEKTRVRHQKKKKRGCLKSLAVTILVLVASVVLIVATIIYFIFYSGPRGPF
ncbi:MAG: hypothetical protein IPM59_06245 [Chloracidobacterium sp.]|nr:hypothetical protein [Chloracidobacterium sp.]